MLFEKMRDAMKEDVVALLASNPPARPVPTRFTRKEAAKRASQGDSIDAPVGGVGAAAPTTAPAAVPESNVGHPCEQFHQRCMLSIKTPWPLCSVPCASVMQ
jgi:hypothetical protein